MSPSRGSWRDGYRFGDSTDYYTDRRNYGEGSYGYDDSRMSAAAVDCNRTSRRGYHHTVPRYDHSHRDDLYGYDHNQKFDHQSRSQPPRRRGSPVYEDYTGPSVSASSSPQPSHSHGHGLNDRDRQQGSSYSNYKPSPQSHRSASPKSPILRPPALSMRVFLPPTSPRRSPTPKRTEPTEDYISTSLAPSTHISDPTSSRKLIVLDLNGSLLLRSAHQKRALPPRPHQSHQHSGSSQAYADPYADSTQLRPLRTVHPRPYLSPFISYLFHPETKKWLDTMVWSSAQPHSVDDMVQKCFKDRKKELKAVWARDTLGLSGDEYHKKTQTTKDLEKPWAELFCDPSPTPIAKPATEAVNTSSTAIATTTSEEPSVQPQVAHSTSAEPRNAEPGLQLQTQTTIQRHSAKSTLLVDDSPLKAILQPWNHLCIKEYVQEMRRKDLEVVEWQWTRRERVGKRLEEEKRRMKEEAAKEAATASSSTLGSGSTSAVAGDEGAQSERLQPQTEGGKGEKALEMDGRVEGEGEEHKLNSHERRKLRRLAKKQEGKKAKGEGRLTTTVTAATTVANEAAASELPAGEVKGESKEAEGPREYDLTLLAVIGILDHLKHEDNIAGWMRAGGLLTVPGVPLPNAPLATFEKEDALPASTATGEIQTLTATTTVEEAEETKLHTYPQLSRDGRTPPILEEQGREKRRRVSVDEDGENVPTSALTLTEVAGEHVEVKATKEVTEVKMEVKAEVDIPPSTPAATTEIQKHEHEQAATGVPTSEPEPPSAPLNSAGDNTITPLELQARPLWYDYPTVFTYWAQRGREALQQLGIEVESGIERVSGGLPPPSSSMSK